MSQNVLYLDSKCFYLAYQSVCYAWLSKLFLIHCFNRLLYYSYYIIIYIFELYKLSSSVGQPFLSLAMLLWSMPTTLPHLSSLDHFIKKCLSPLTSTSLSYNLEIQSFILKVMKARVIAIPFSLSLKRGCSYTALAISL